MRRDDEVRNNYLQYGNPDGKQSFSMGIALPKFIISEGHGKYTMAFYLGLVGVFLPWLVSRWWYGTQKVTKDGVLVKSAGNLFRYVTSLYTLSLRHTSSHELI